MTRRIAIESGCIALGMISIAELSRRMDMGVVPWPFINFLLLAVLFVLLGAHYSRLQVSVWAQKRLDLVRRKLESTKAVDMWVSIQPKASDNEVDNDVRAVRLHLIGDVEPGMAHMTCMIDSVEVELAASNAKASEWSV